MYKSFYKLDREPFDLQPDPAFLWMGEKYKEAMSVLRYGILDNKGLVLLTGESGVGKTTLLLALTESLPPDILCTFLVNPDVPKMDMFNLIGKGFGMNKEYNSKVEFLLDFQTFLQERHDEGKKVLLIVDSAHLLSDENLEELRLLSNIEQGDSKLIRIIFSAQPSFNTTLNQPNNNAIRQRLSLNHTIEPLTAQEACEYIGHRFSVAGVEDRIFTKKAIHAMHEFSGGIPKKVNILCQQVLIEGAKEGVLLIDEGVVQECMQRFIRPDDSRHTDFAADSMPGHGGNGKSFNSRMLVYGLSAFALLVIGAGYIAWLQRDHGNHTTTVATTLPPVKADTHKKADTPKADTPADSIHIIVHPTANGTPDGNGKGKDAAKKSTAEKGDLLPASTTASAANQQAAPATSSPQAANDKAEGIIIDSQQQKTPAPPPARDTDATTSAKAVPQLKAILPLRANSRSLTDEGQTALTDFVEKFKEAGHGKIEVRGYVSSNNDVQENTQLSIRRAEAVQAMLIRAGVDRASIKVRGMGIQNPLADNDTPEGRNKNRRVELEMIP